MENAIFNSATCVIRSQSSEQKLHMWSARGYAQRILIVNRFTERTLGTVEVSALGTLIIRPDHSHVLSDVWPVLWSTQVVMMIGIDDDTEFDLIDCIENTEYTFRYVRNGHRFIVSKELISGTAQHDLPAIVDKRNALQLTIHQQPAFEQELQSSIENRLHNLAVQNDEYFAQPSTSGAATVKTNRVRRSSSSLSESSMDLFSIGKENTNEGQGACCMALVRYTGPKSTEDSTVAVANEHQSDQATDNEAVRQLKIKLRILKEKFLELKRQ